MELCFCLEWCFITITTKFMCGNRFYCGSVSLVFEFKKERKDELSKSSAVLSREELKYSFDWWKDRGRGVSYLVSYVNSIFATDLWEKSDFKIYTYLVKNICFRRVIFLVWVDGFHNPYIVFSQRLDKDNLFRKLELTVVLREKNPDTMPPIYLKVSSWVVRKF